MAARFPQSATSIAYRIKPAYAGKVLAIYWPASADAVHRLYPGDNATTILTRSTSGAGFNATEGRITGNVVGASGVYFADSRTGGLGTTEDGPLTYIGSYFGDLFNGAPAGGVWLFGCGTPMDIFNDRTAAKANSYGIDMVRRGAATLTMGSAISMADDVPALCTLAYRLDPSDTTAHHRIWANGAEVTSMRATGVPSSGLTVGATASPFRFGGTMVGSGNTKMEGECWIVGTDLSDAQLSAITADPSIVIEPYSAGVAPTVTTHPSAQSVLVGATATFTAAGTGTPAPSWQWQRNPGGSGSWANIAEATADSYTTAAATVSGGTANNGDAYRVVLTNATGSVTSNAATLTVSAGGTLNFQGAGEEFGGRTGVGIDTISADAGVNYRYTVHADALVIGAAIITSPVIALDGAAKLPNLTHGSLVPGTWYRVHAVRQSDGEAISYRMQAA